MWVRTADISPNRHKRPRQQRLRKRKRRTRRRPPHLRRNPVLSTVNFRTAWSWRQTNSAMSSTRRRTKIRCIRAEPALIREAEPTREAEPAGIRAVEPAGIRAVEPTGIRAAEPAGIRAVEPAHIRVTEPTGIRVRPGRHSRAATGPRLPARRLIRGQGQQPLRTMYPALERRRRPQGLRTTITPLYLQPPGRQNPRKTTAREVPDQ